MTNDVRQHPTYVISGLRARPIREWFQHLSGPAVLSLIVWGRGTDLDFLHFLMITIAVLIATYFIVKMARGRIELHPDRLQIVSWNDDKFIALTANIPLGDVRKIEVRGSGLLISHVTDGSRKHRWIALVAPVAEELCDRVVEQMERIPALEGRVEQLSSGCFIVKAAADETGSVDSEDDRRPASRA